MPDEREARAAADATIARFIDAGERLDLPAFLETLAPEVRLRSPISGRVRFEGFDEVKVVLEEFFDLVSDVDYFEDVGTSATRALFFRARVRGQAAESAMLVRLDERALVTEMTLFFRPLPGLAALTASITPRLTARRGRLRGLVVAAMTRPVAAITPLADALGVWLLQSRRR